MIFQSRYFLELEYFIYLRSFFSFICFFCYDVLVLTSQDMWFIVIKKQEDLPTDLELKNILHGANKLQEFVMPSGDMIVASKEMQEIGSISVPLNEKASLMYGEEIYGHCYLIKKNVNY